VMSKMTPVFHAEHVIYSVDVSFWQEVASCLIKHTEVRQSLTMFFGPQSEVGSHSTSNRGKIILLLSLLGYSKGKDIENSMEVCYRWEYVMLRPSDD
jgi:hypothetical protein